MQSYKNNPRTSDKIRISAYKMLILVINQTELCAKLGITPAYAKHIPMLREYLDMLQDRQKKTYIYAYLAEKYGMHTSSVRRVIVRLLRTIEV